jgi:hypothetical protein
MNSSAAQANGSAASSFAACSTKAEIAWLLDAAPLKFVVDVVKASLSIRAGKPLLPALILICFRRQRLSVLASQRW